MTSLQAGARCALHPERLATLTCERCGNFACAACATDDLAGRLCNSCQEVSGEFRYHVVPVWRLVVMSVLSFGLYHIYWVYRNWQAVKQADRSSIWPIARGLFCGFTYFMLCSDLNTYATLRRQSEGVSTMVPLGFLVTSTFQRLPDPWWLLSVASVVFLTPAADRIWSLATERARARARTWSIRHSVVVVVGGVLWLAVLYSFGFET